MSIVHEFNTIAGRVLRDHQRVDSLQVVRVAPTEVGPLVEWTGGPVGPPSATIHPGVTYRGTAPAQALLATIARMLACRWREGAPVPALDWDAFLHRRHPLVFHDGIDTGAGWQWVWQAGAERIQEAGVPRGFRTDQAKEKFGGIRWYHHADEDSPVVSEIIECVEAVSQHVCDVCGAPGSIRQGAWLRALCTAHHEEQRR